MDDDDRRLFLVLFARYQGRHTGRDEGCDRRPSHTRLDDVLAKHAGETDWAETVVDDESLFAQWVSMGPGQKTPRRMNAASFNHTTRSSAISSGILRLNRLRTLPR